MKKRNIAIWSSVIIASTLLVVGTSLMIDKKKANEVVVAQKISSLSEVKNYNLYYGYDFSDTIIESMGKYDLVVVEPLNIRYENILPQIRNQGVSVFGYLSFGEVSPYDQEMLSKVDDSEYLRINGEKVENWGCNVVDIRSENFQNNLMELVQTRIIDGGYDGLFIDTLDDFEFIALMQTEELVDEMTSEVAKLLKRVRTEFPDLKIIVNRAFTGIDKCEEKYVDAVLFENMSSLKNNEYFDNMVAKIDNFTAKGGVCLSFSNEASQEVSAKKMAKEKGWIHYYRPDQEYTKWYEYLNK